MLLGPRSRDTFGDDKIKSEVMYAGERRYYLDLKENSRGRFLKVTTVFGRPFVKLFALCYRSVVCPVCPSCL